MNNQVQDYLEVIYHWRFAYESSVKSCNLINRRHLERTGHQTTRSEEVKKKFTKNNSGFCLFPFLFTQTLLCWRTASCNIALLNKNTLLTEITHLRNMMIWSVTGSQCLFNSMKYEENILKKKKLWREEEN